MRSIQSQESLAVEEAAYVRRTPPDVAGLAGGRRGDMRQGKLAARRQPLPCSLQKEVKPC